MRIEIAGLLLLAAGAARAAPPTLPPTPPNFPMITASDFGRPTLALDGGCFATSFAPPSAADGLTQTLQTAIRTASDYGRRMGADGMSAMTVAWESPNSTTGVKGRVLLCGTFVKFK